MMKFRNRIKSAFHAFKNPGIVEKSVHQKVLLTEYKASIVLDNQLLAGKNILITGAGRNIGKSIALEMAKQGANIFFTDIVRESCSKLETELSEYPIKYKGFVSDVSKAEDSDSLYNYFLENEINIDVLVNNVGIQFETTTINKLELEEWQKVYAHNVFGPMYLTKLISQMMVSNNIQGSIIFITSMHQWEIVGWASYSSSKAALGMIINELAVELAANGVRVNGIAPGAIGEDEEGNSIPHNYTPLHKSLINPCYIGRAAVYLASEYFSQFTTGTVIKIDAGLSLYNYRVTQMMFQQ